MYVFKSILTNVVHSHPLLIGEQVNVWWGGVTAKARRLSDSFQTGLYKVLLYMKQLPGLFVVPWNEKHETSRGSCGTPQSSSPIRECNFLKSIPLKSGLVIQ